MQSEVSPSLAKIWPYIPRILRGLLSSAITAQTSSHCHKRRLHRQIYGREFRNVPQMIQLKCRPRHSMTLVDCLGRLRVPFPRITAGTRRFHVKFGTVGSMVRGDNNGILVATDRGHLRLSPMSYVIIISSYVCVCVTRMTQVVSALFLFRIK